MTASRRTPAPEGEVVCSGCEGRPVFPNVPCAVCGASPVVPAPEGEVVAWRWKPLGMGWQIVGLTEQRPHYAEPLYASPVVPVGVRQRVLDELDKAWLHGQRRTSWRRDESADAILAALRPTDTGANHD
jgi:hypothetical protein